MLRILFSFLAVPTLLVRGATLDYTITNQCPQDITLYINGVSQGSLAANGGSTTRTMTNFDGFIFTDANGGNQDGSGTTRAGFYGDQNEYYLVIDPSHFNTGVEIDPVGGVPKEGFCGTPSCTDITCIFAFLQPPTGLPPASNIAPQPPLYQCPVPFNTGYRVTFCPGGAFPLNPEDGRAIHPDGNNAKCLDVRGAVFADGTPVQIYDCNETNAQKWVIFRGQTQLRVAGTNFCLDAGLNPGSGVPMKIWTCYDNLPQQTWYYTNDDRIALLGQGQCLDLTNGVLTNSNTMQIWQCTDLNVNQIWTLQVFINVLYLQTAMTDFLPLPPQINEL